MIRTKIIALHNRYLLAGNRFLLSSNTPPKSVIKQSEEIYKIERKQQDVSVVSAAQKRVTNKQ